MTWTLTDDIAEKNAGVWTLRGPLQAPENGWQIGCGESSELDRLLALTSSVAMPVFQEADRPLEDLVARYRPSAEAGISLDIRYQLLNVSPSRLVLQATYAIQTREFETHPSLQIAIPGLPETELATINRAHVGAMHLAVLMQPCDLAQARRVDAPQDGGIQFYGDFMERGVIRKCRLRLILSPLSQQELQAEEEFEALMREPLPLVS
ncbi:hypothetical protein CA51_07720 [Rosistilla oblonga]|uniref:Uncharacterized protein n=1 Tax=Rosistilla oblonga TaxID=2527990 RepID=A0A518INU4_9BACT|nr:hypothetical protein [Rosistilla oblonga]QDV10918.1 hypothetical protein CA51_07720 [Rosistilla oblonga]QDV54755.1 hypothetical protein Mal33_07150 [Rosistilla oblonga]